MSGTIKLKIENEATGEAAEFTLPDREEFPMLPKVEGAAGETYIVPWADLLLAVGKEGTSEEGAFLFPKLLRIMRRVFTDGPSFEKLAEKHGVEKALAMYREAIETKIARWTGKEALATRESIDPLAREYRTLVYGAARESAGTAVKVSMFGQTVETVTKAAREIGFPKGTLDGYLKDAEKIVAARKSTKTVKLTLDLSKLSK